MNMQRISLILLGFLVVGTVVHQSVAEFNDTILKEIKPKTISIIGETHQQKESIWFFQRLVMDSLQKNLCLTVGLEISSNQQTVINRVMQGKATALNIEIPSMIDHLPFRKMIDSLAGLNQNGACLNLVAIDAGNDIKMDRDQWMAFKLADQVGDTPILVLLGGLHILKRVPWNLSMTDPSPSVSEILNAQGYRVRTYPQVWTTEKCANQKGFRQRWIPADTPEALTILNTYFISLINAFNFKTAAGVIDGLVVWECRE